MDDTTMTPQANAILDKVNEFKCLNELKAGLKILGWVTLTCRFDSGPRHHFSLITNTYKILLRKGFCLKTSQKECFVVVTDTTMTPPQFSNFHFLSSQKDAKLPAYILNNTPKDGNTRRTRFVEKTQRIHIHHGGTFGLVQTLFRYA